MSLLENEEAITTLNEIAKELNLLSSDNGATGNVAFRDQKPEANVDKWEVYVEGKISAGQDNDGRELWESPKLHDCYVGKTLADAVEQIVADVKREYPGIKLR